MPRRCVAAHCSMSPSFGISLFRFPKDKKIASKWTEHVLELRVNFTHSATSVLCALHFKDEDFDNLIPFKMGFHCYLALKPGAIPTVHTKNVSAERIQFLTKPGHGNTKMAVFERVLQKSDRVTKSRSSSSSVRKKLTGHKVPNRSRKIIRESPTKVDTHPAEVGEVCLDETVEDVIIMKSKKGRKKNISEPVKEEITQPDNNGDRQEEEDSDASSAWCTTMFRSFFLQMKDKRGVDIQITTQDNKLCYGHSLILSTASPVLGELCDAPKKSAGAMTKIRVSRYTKEVMDALIHFIYTGLLGSFSCPTDMLLDAAKYFKMKHLIELVKKQMDAPPALSLKIKSVNTISQSQFHQRKNQEVPAPKESKVDESYQIVECKQEKEDGNSNHGTEVTNAKINGNNPNAQPECEGPHQPTKRQRSSSIVDVLADRFLGRTDDDGKSQSLEQPRDVKAKQTKARVTYEGKLLKRRLGRELWNDGRIPQIKLRKMVDSDEVQHDDPDDNDEDEDDSNDEKTGDDVVMSSSDRDNLANQPSSDGRILTAVWNGKDTLDRKYLSGLLVLYFFYTGDKKTSGKKCVVIRPWSHRVGPIFACGVCPAIFTCKADWKIHRKTQCPLPNQHYTETFIYACKHCGAALLDINAVKQHFGRTRSGCTALLSPFGHNLPEMEEIKNKAYVFPIDESTRRIPNDIEGKDRFTLVGQRKYVRFHKIATCVLHSEGQTLTFRHCLKCNFKTTAHYTISSRYRCTGMTDGEIGNAYICKACSKVFYTIDSVLNHIRGKWSFGKPPCPAFQASSGNIVSEMNDDDALKNSQLDVPSSDHVNEEKEPLEDTNQSQMLQEETNAINLEEVSHVHEEDQESSSVDVISPVTSIAVDASDRGFRVDTPPMIADVNLHTRRRKQTYFCTVCGEEFQSNAGLRVHAMKHSFAKKYKCDSCSKRFKDKVNFDTHRLTHMRKKDNVEKSARDSVKKNNNDSKVSIEDASVVTVDSKKTKETFIHTYACALCYKLFHKVETFEDHLVEHNEKCLKEMNPGPEGKNVCALCLRAFRSRSALKQHLFAHNESKVKYTCAVCRETCVGNMVINAHRQSHGSTKDVAFFKMTENEKKSVQICRSSLSESRNVQKPVSKENTTVTASDKVDSSHGSSSSQADNANKDVQKESKMLHTSSVPLRKKNEDQASKPNLLSIEMDQSKKKEDSGDHSELLSPASSNDSIEIPYPVNDSPEDQHVEFEDVTEHFVNVKTEPAEGETQVELDDDPLKSGDTATIARSFYNHMSQIISKFVKEKNKTGNGKAMFLPTSSAASSPVPAELAAARSDILSARTTLSGPKSEAASLRPEGYSPRAQVSSPSREQLYSPPRAQVSSPPRAQVSSPPRAQVSSRHNSVNHKNNSAPQSPERKIPEVVLSSGTSTPVSMSSQSAVPEAEAESQKAAKTEAPEQWSKPDLNLKDLPSTDCTLNTVKNLYQAWADSEFTCPSPGCTWMSSAVRVNGWAKERPKHLAKKGIVAHWLINHMSDGCCVRYTCNVASEIGATRYLCMEEFYSIDGLSNHLETMHKDLTESETMDHLMQAQKYFYEDIAAVPSTTDWEPVWKPHHLL